MIVSPMNTNYTAGYVARSAMGTLMPSAPTTAQDSVVFSGRRHKNRDRGHSQARGTEQFQRSQPQPAPTVRKHSGPYYDATADKAARDKFYQGVDLKQTGSALFDSLNRVLSRSHHGLDYDPSDNLYPEVDRRPDNQLYSIYAGDGPKNIGEAGIGSPASNFNCEHVVPQSWFSKREPMRGDLHHLFTCETNCNSIRGNAPYTDLPDHDGDGQEMIIACGISTDDRSQFEPKAGKGEVARAVLYFLVRYPGQIGDRSNEYSPKDLDLLLQWHHENPVTDYERHRNARIEEMQGNRNPFVDFPDLADKVDFTQGFGRPR